MKIKLSAIVVACLLMVGCQSAIMKPAANQTLSTPAQDTARMIFMRTSMYGGAIQSAVFDITGGKVKFIGIVSAKTRVVYDAPPGKRMFMVVSESADFMAAEMDGGKTYRSLVLTRTGIWKARFSLLPVRKAAGSKHGLSSRHVMRGMKQPIIENKPESAQWYQKNKADILRKYKVYWPKWVAKSKAHKALRTVFAADGI